MTIILAFIAGIVFTFVLSTIAALVMGAVIHGRTIIDDRAQEPSPYDDDADRYLEGYSHGYEVAWSEAKRSSKPQNTRIV